MEIPSRGSEAVLCPYCREQAELVNGERIYPHRKDLFSKKFWLCEACDARVGCHRNSKTPLGRLANAELRKAKMAAHGWFDPIWKNKEMSRNKAYKWLADQLGIESSQCHIGMFDIGRCEQVVDICKTYRKEKRV